MGFGSIWPWLIVLAIVLLLFGRGKVSGLMGDVAQGVKSFRRGLADDDADTPAQIENRSETATNTADTNERSTTTT